MINNIRYSASQLLELSNNIPVQITNFNTNQPNNNSFEKLMLEKNSSNETNDTNNTIFGSLGIPAGFNIDFSMLDEAEKADL